MAYNVLIVDDSKSMRKVILKTLQLSGFELGECLEASNGQEALDILEGKWIDLILSDVHMPVMDGFGFIRSLKEKDIFRDTPVVFVTTEANEDRLNRVDVSRRQRLHSQTVSAGRDRRFSEPHHGGDRWRLEWEQVLKDVISEVLETMFFAMVEFEE